MTLLYAYQFSTKYLFKNDHLLKIHKHVNVFCIQNKAHQMHNGVYLSTKSNACYTQTVTEYLNIHVNCLQVMLP